jgi:mannose-1-phosphate guanylyltransferase
LYLAHEDLLTRNLNIPFVPSYNHSIVIKNSEIGKNVIFNEWVYIEESSIEDNTSLSKVVSWKGAYIKSGKYKNCILI